MVIFTRGDEIFCYQLIFNKNGKFESTKLILKAKAVVNYSPVGSFLGMQVMAENNVSIIIRTKTALTYFYDIATGNMKLGWEIKTNANTHEMITSFKYYPSERLVLLKRENGSIYYVYPHFEVGSPQIFKIDNMATNSSTKYSDCFCYIPTLGVLVESVGNHIMISRSTRTDGRKLEFIFS